jgi:hypothetical protein
MPSLRYRLIASTAYSLVVLAARMGKDGRESEVIGGGSRRPKVDGNGVIQILGDVPDVNFAQVLTAPPFI